MRKHSLLKTMLLLCALIVGSSSAWADESYSLTPDGTTTGSSATSYITTLTEFTFDEVKWKMNYWNPSTLQVKTNQANAADEFRFYNTSAFAGRITKVVITFSALTIKTDCEDKFMFKGGTSEVTATTGGTAGTWDNTKKVLTWEPGASDNFTYFAFYQDGKAASGNNFLAETDAIVVTYETSGPSAKVSTTSLDFGEVEVEKTSQKTFTVTPANLTGDLTIASNNGKYTVNPTTIAQDASGAQTITVTAAPTAWNDVMTGTITISGGGLTSNKTVTLTATPYQVANVTLVGANGTFKVNNEPATSLTFTSRVGNTAAIKAEPNEHYTFTSWAADGATPESSVSPYQVFTFTAATVTLTATFTEDAKHKATFYVLGAESEIEVYEDDAITFPSVTAPTGYTFMGWTANEISTAQSAAPADLTTSANMGDANVTYYAVFAKSTGDSSDTYALVSDVNDLAEGDKVVLYSSGSYTVSGVSYNFSKANGALDGKFADVDVTVADNKFTSTDVVPMTLVKSGDSWKFKIGNQYVSAVNKGASLNDSGSLNTISISSTGAATITASISSTNYKLQYNPNSGSGRFAYYSSTQKAVSLYKQEAGYSDYCTTVPPVSVTITAAEYATYCGTDALDFSETDIIAFTATDNGDKVKLNKIESGQVPANTPVVLYLTNGGTVDVPVIASAEAVGDNDLNVSDGNAVNDYMYVLANKTNGVGFYLWDNSNSNAIPEGKIYLQATSTSRSFLGFEEGNTTSIDVRSKMEDVRGEVYNLNGQRVVQPTKGLYIVNGKKVVIK